jgi:hypothetical protein
MGGVRVSGTAGCSSIVVEFSVGVGSLCAGVWEGDFKVK